MSVEATFASANFMDDNYVFVDCPGSIEFLHDMRSVLPAVDAAVVVCEADEKKVPQLQLILRELEAELGALEAFRPQQDRLVRLMEQKERVEFAYCQVRVLLQRKRAGYGPAPRSAQKLEHQAGELRARIESRSRVSGSGGTLPAGMSIAGPPACAAKNSFFEETKLPCC